MVFQSKMANLMNVNRSRDQAPSALGRVFVIVVYVHRGVSRDVVPDGRTDGRRKQRDGSLSGP